MKNVVVAALFAIAAGGAFADNHHGLPPGVEKKLAHCEDCGVVHAIHKETRKGSGGAAGIVGGALVGGLLGHQLGGGTGKTLATVAGAGAGAYAGNEVQKRVNSKTVWITEVRMRDGSVHKFEQEHAPGWKTGSLVKVHGNSLAVLTSGR